MKRRFPNIAARLLALPVQAYRLLLSPWIGHGCRFQPTCSCYALDALERHGALGGGYLAVRRLARCHPFGASGFDPVPATFSFSPPPPPMPQASEGRGL